MPIPIDGGGAAEQTELGTTWHLVADTFENLGHQLAGVPIVGPILSEPFLTVAGLLREAGDLHSSFQALYSKVIEAIEALQSGATVEDVLGILYPDWSEFTSDPVQWLRRLLREAWPSFEYVEAWWQGEVVPELASAAARMMETLVRIVVSPIHGFEWNWTIIQSQLFHQAVDTQNQWLLNCFYRFFPWLSPLLEDESAGLWSYFWEWLQGNWERLGEFQLPTWEDLWQWIEDHIPWVVEWLSRVGVMILYYAFEGSLPTTDGAAETPDEGGET